MINTCSNYAYNLSCLDGCALLRTGPKCEVAPVDNLYDGDAYQYCPFFTDHDYNQDKVKDIFSPVPNTLDLGLNVVENSYIKNDACLRCLVIFKNDDDQKIIPY